MDSKTGERIRRHAEKTERTLILKVFDLV
jgi:hypothetical protein